MASIVSIVTAWTGFERPGRHRQEKCVLEVKKTCPFLTLDVVDYGILELLKVIHSIKKAKLNQVHSMKLKEMVKGRCGKSQSDVGE